MTPELNTWHVDGSGCLAIHLLTPTGERVHAWIARRPVYCDRGHWQFMVEGLHDIDGADSFPRYFVDLNAAVEEAERFLRWRIWRASNYNNTNRSALLPFVARRFDP